MAQVLERTGGHYEVRKFTYGKDYTWYPECAVIECSCGERLTITTAESICGCGADHAALVREELEDRESGRSPNPEDECREWKSHKDEYLRSERNDQLEWEALE